MDNPPLPRPGALDRSQSFEPPRSNNNLHHLGFVASANASMTSLALADLPSPRAGEVPPALSPLDALALQGRLLAKRFEQQDNKTGRRLSRLAPLTIQNEFGNRPGYFSSLSSSTVNSPNEELGPIMPRPEMSPRNEVSDKHKSFYPQFGGDEHQQFNHPMPMRNALAPIGETSPGAQIQRPGYFDIPRSHSPEAAEPRIGLHEATPVTPNASTPQTFLSPQKKRSDSQPRSQPRPNLLAPRSSSSLHSQKSPRLSPSVRPVRSDSSADEAEDMSLSSSYDSIHRQNQNLSPSSSLSRTQSPLVAGPGAFIPRSPSVSSDYSISGLPRPTYNFSRPMSRSSARPSLDMRAVSDAPSRQFSDESAYMRPSFDSHPRRQDSYDSPITNYSNETVHTPVSMMSEDFRRSGDYGNPSGTYTYSKFSLPRGRKLDRQSIGIEDFFKSQITWDQPSQGQARPPSPESPPRSFDRNRVHQANCPRRDPSLDRTAPSLTSSNSTIRARTAGGSDTTAQEHCDIGLELHEAGELLKSTYHLRLAARAGLPEAMFWYGLACRHGWGMRENKTEALQWLRRAVDSGQLEVADDEDQDKQGQPTDFLKKKQHRAQYAVAIYELGKCYGNGWGAAQDKPLALRCYEIAGSWGDADALVEAGYCYAEGVGCKKDMKKAARLYRSAESKGVSMVGNSWIYKDKYMGDDNSSATDTRSIRSGRSEKKSDSAKKPRDKSRTRTIFGRKKSTTTGSK